MQRLKFGDFLNSSPIRQVKFLAKFFRYTVVLYPVDVPGRALNLTLCTAHRNAGFELCFIWNEIAEIIDCHK